MIDKRVDKLWEEQLSTWEFAYRQYEALKRVKVRQLNVDGSCYRIQFNPARAVSSCAKVDKDTLAKRACFLCDENRPDRKSVV